MTQPMGFEGKTYIGPAGSTATNQLLNRRDATITADQDRGNTTVAGDGTKIPINTERPVTINWSAEVTYINDTNDTQLADMRTAAADGTARAFRMIDYAAGKGYDGDCTIAERLGAPLNGEQTFTFTFTPTREAGRDPLLYV